jgi:hypothetical protein
MMAILEEARGPEEGASQNGQYASHSVHAFARLSNLLQILLSVVDPIVLS